MDLFGNKVDIKIETVILFLLIGIVIVLLLFCFEPWKASSPARDPSPQQVTIPVKQVGQHVANDSKINVVEPFQQVTKDARILYKKVGFTSLGSDGKDAKVNILLFKTRPIKDSEKDFQVAYMFTQDIETLKSLNKGEPVTLLDSSATTTTSTVPVSVTPVYNSFTAGVMAQSAYPTLNRELCKQLGLPEDYVTFAMDLADKVLADYNSRQNSDAPTKLLAAQELIKAEFNKLPTTDGQEWQKRLKNGVSKVKTDLIALPNATIIANTNILPSSYLSVNANKIRITVIAFIESIIYANNPAPFNLAPLTSNGALLKYMYANTVIQEQINKTVADDLYPKITKNPTKLLTDTDLNTSQATFQAGLTSTFEDKKTISTADIGLISNAIYYTFRVFLYGKFIDMSDITTTTTQPAAAPTGETDPQIIQVLQAIGSKYYDPATGERKARDRDFYLEFSNGLEINIKFLFNYVTNMTGEVKCEATITELPLGTAADPAYKTYKFDTCQLDYIGNRMIITFTKTTGPVNYAKINKTDGGKYDKVTVIQTFKLEINVGDTQISESADTFQSIIERVVFYNTFMSYSLSAKLEDSAGSVKPIYTLNLFPQSITSSFESLKEYTKSALNKTTERLLKDNVAEIVTPMFIVDQRLDRTEGILAKIKDHYRFNELSNAQSGYRFYPVSE